MYKVIKKPLTPNIVWDADNNKPLCRFVNGVLETNDKAIVAKLAAMGHSVEGGETVTAEEVTEASTPKTTRRSRK